MSFPTVEVIDEYCCVAKISIAKNERLISKYLSSPSVSLFDAVTND